MQFIGEIISSVRETTVSPSVSKTETMTPIEPDRFQQMLDQSIAEQNSPKEEKKLDNTQEAQRQPQDNEEKNVYKEKDISEKKNRTQNLSRNDSKESKDTQKNDKKAETTDPSGKAALNNAKTKNPEIEKNISKTQIDLKEVKKQKKKDLTIDNFDDVMKDLDKIINNIKASSPETSKIHKEFETIKESLNKSVNEGLMPDLKKLTRLLELIKHELASLKTDKHEKLPRLNLLALEKKINDIEKKLSQKKHYSKENPGNEKEIKITSTFIEESIKNTQKEKHDGFTAGNEKQGRDNNLNISPFKTQAQAQTDKSFNSIKSPVDTPRFREQMDNILDRAKVVVKDNRNAAFTLKLHPRELGAVNIHLGLEQGVLNGRFLVDTPEARTLLMQNLELVREELAQSGVSVGEFQVDVRSHQQYDAQGEDIIPQNLSQALQKETGAAYDIQSVQWHSGSINMVI